MRERWALASLAGVLALGGCLLFSPLDDVAEVDDDDDGGNGSAGAPVAAPPVGGVPGSSGAGAGGAGSGSSPGGAGGSLVCADPGGGAVAAGPPRETWCQDPVEIWGCNNPYVLRLTNPSELCPEIKDTEFFVSREEGKGCDILDATAAEAVCAYAESQLCTTMTAEGEEVPLLLEYAFAQSSPGAPIEGLLVVTYPTGDSCSYDAALIPASEL